MDVLAADQLVSRPDLRREVSCACETGLGEKENEDLRGLDEQGSSRKRDCTASSDA